MDYNTQRTKLTLPEYGRNIQKMVDFLKTITDREERNKQTESVVKSMLQMMPDFKDNDEFREKVWRHLFIMADFDIDVDCPFEITRENSEAYALETLPYNQLNRTLTSYGRIIEELMNKAIDYEGPEEDRVPVIMSIANQMKKIYLLWHKDAVADSVIIDDVKRLSKGKLTLPEGTLLMNVRDLVPHNTATTRPPAKKKFIKKPAQKRYQSNGGGRRFS